jgi:hypothetical protein
MGATLELAKQDARKYVNSGGFNQSLLITPTSGDPVTIQGLATRHSMGFDTDGKPIVSDNAHCSFSELDLTDEGLTVRNANGDLIIKGWLIQFTDAIGTATYKINEPYPDKILGIIRCTLSIYE